MKRKKLAWRKVRPHVSVSDGGSLALRHTPFSLLCLVHLRNIDASELEIVQFGLSFGKISNVLNLRKKNQVESRMIVSPWNSLSSVRPFCNSIASKTPKP